MYRLTFVPSFFACRLHLLVRLFYSMHIKKVFLFSNFLFFLFPYLSSSRVPFLSISFSLLWKCLLSSHTIIAIVVVIPLTFAMRMKKDSSSIWSRFVFFPHLFYKRHTTLEKWLRITINMWNGIGFRAAHSHIAFHAALSW